MNSNCGIWRHFSDFPRSISLSWNVRDKTVRDCRVALKFAWYLQNEVHVHVITCLDKQKHAFYSTKTSKGLSQTFLLRMHVFRMLNIFT